jgi:prepilin-type N-terminal cleavage/methylation domain-containing protein/prepilin-type processing-associated H-X9-DG protein
MKSPLSPRHGAFTLIEILCVIVIIAVIAAMTMPAFNGARDKADGMTCTSNLRQIGIAVQGYVTEHDGHYPMVETDPEHPSYQPDDNAKGLLETITPYGGTKDVVQCPSDVKSFNYYAKWKTSYEWRPYVDDELESAPHILTPRGQMTRPPSKIVVCSDVERVHGLRTEFLSKKNYLYADGHVRPYWETPPRTPAK